MRSTVQKRPTLERVRVWGKADEYPYKCTTLDLDNNGVRRARFTCYARLELHVALRHDVVISGVQAAQAHAKNRVVRHDLNWTVVWLCPGRRARNRIVESRIERCYHVTPPAVRVIGGRCVQRVRVHERHIACSVDNWSNPDINCIHGRITIIISHGGAVSISSATCAASFGT